MNFDHEGTLITCWPIPQQFKKQYVQRTQPRQDEPHATDGA